MSNEYAPNMLTLTDTDGNELEFEILDVIEDEDGTRFFALLPNFETDMEDDGAYYILMEQEVDGEMELCEIDDEELLNTLAKEFEAKFEELYDEEDEEDEE